MCVELFGEIVPNALGDRSRCAVATFNVACKVGEPLSGFVPYRRFD